MFEGNSNKMLKKSQTIMWVVIGGNYPEGSCPEGNYPRWKLSAGHLSKADCTITIQEIGSNHYIFSHTNLCYFLQNLLQCSLHITPSETLTFLDRWDLCWKCTSDTIWKWNKKAYNRNEEQQLSFYKNAHNTT